MKTSQFARQGPTNIKSVFEASAPDFQVDAKLIERIIRFENGFVNQNTNHIEFFGSNLTGVKPMRFQPSDRTKWFVDVLDIDEVSIEEGIEQLPINKDWIRANDVFNHSCVWVVHKILNSDISPSLKEAGCIATMQVLQYRFLGSLLHRNYPYPAEEGLALATVAAMSRKFALKKAGTWHKMLYERAKDIMDTRAVHRRAYVTMESDKHVIDMISDIQNRLKEVIKAINKIFYDLHKRGVRLHTEKSVKEINGSVVLMDKTRQFSNFTRYIHTVLDDKASFVRDELLDVIADVMHTMPPQQLRQTLEWMSSNRGLRQTRYIDELVDETLIYAFETISNDRELYNARGGLTPLLVRLRSMYMASRMADQTLIKTKELAEKVVESAVNTKSPSTIASIRTGLQLYIVLRAMSMYYYQN